MSKLKKFLIVFLSFLPLSAGAIAPLVIGLIAAAVGITGVSIYRNITPVNMNEAFDFFSSCWTCNLFSSLMSYMSRILPIIYNNVAKVIIPVAFGLMAIYLAWQIFSSFVKTASLKPMSMNYEFGKRLIRLSLVSIVLLAPLPKIISSTMIEPIFSVGLTMNHVLDDKGKYAECIVSTSLIEQTAMETQTTPITNREETFSTKLRSGLACELANVHHITGMGLTIGWVMLNMAFDIKYMHKILWKIPFFPNIPLLACGLLVLALFLIALFPIPFYFLEVFMTLTLDLIMLPLLLLSWIFSGWKAVEIKGTKSFKQIIDSVISGAVGISMTIIFLTFALKLLDVLIGSISGISRLNDAFAQNNAEILIDGLMLRDDSLLTILLLGIFFAIFMSSIPALVKSLFNFDISSKFYDTVKNDAKILGKKLGNWWDALKNKKSK